MLNPVSVYHSNTTQTRSTGCAFAHCAARVLLQTATSLSVAGPGRAAGGRSGRRIADRKHSRASPAVQSAQSARQQMSEERRSARRVRPSSRSTGRTANDRASVHNGPADPSLKKTGKTGKKGTTGRQQPPRPAGGRTGSTAAAGSRRRQRPTEALNAVQVTAERRWPAVPQQLPDRAQAPTGRRRRKAASDCAAPIALGQNNFTRLLEDLSACYRLVENVTLTQDLERRLPIGDAGRPFRGRLDGAGHSLGVNLTRAQGDAVLFGALDQSRLHLAVVGAHLETRNGSRAALIGTLGAHNQVTLSRLENSLFHATGEGTVEAALIASTRGGGNRLHLHQARGNRIQARAFPASPACQSGCEHRALASLGLGVLLTGGRDKSAVVQRHLHDNQLQAVAGYVSGERAGGHSPATATAGLLAVLGDTPAPDQALYGWQRDLRNNQVLAHAQDRRAAEDSPGAGGRSCASLGCGSVRCVVASSVASREEGAAGARLWLSQTACQNNSVQAQGGIARASLASVEPLRFLSVRQMAVGPGQVLALAARGPAERALLAPVRETLLRLYSGGDAKLPLLASWDGAINVCRRQSVLDTAGYQVGDFNCHRPDSGNRSGPVRYSSLTPRGWRAAHHSLDSSGFPCLSFRNSACCGPGSTLHYPQEALQSLAQSASEWFLVTRQRYPWQPENNQQGLLRLTPYRLVDDSGPQTAAAASAGGVILYQARARDPVLQDSRPLASLVAGHRLYQLYQGAGAPIQLTGMAINGTDSHYALIQYETLAGKARLLSMEDGELHLWIEDRNNTVLAYGLGQEPLDNSSRWLHWGFDLSDQPGHHTLLARAGDWLYSLRQQDGQPASLRRRHRGTGALDARWQPVWPGNVTQALRLVVASGHLRALPAGSLAGVDISAPGFQARVPAAGGCLQWSRMALAHYPLPADLVSTAGAPAPSASPASDVPAEDGEAKTQRSGKIDADDLLGIVTAIILGTAAALWPLWRVFWYCAPRCPRWCRQQRQQAAAAQDRARRAADRPAHSRSVFSIRSEETAL